MIIRIWICLLALTSFAVAEPVKGRDYLALQHARFKAGQAADYLQAGQATGNLDWTFGESLGPVETLLQRARPSFHRVHILNTVCVRNGNCGRYEPLAGYRRIDLEIAILKKDKKVLNKLKSRVWLYMMLAKQYPNTKMLVSPVLEHDLGQKAWRVLADAVLEVWPDAQLVNSPNKGIKPERYRGAWIESHGSKPLQGADIVSTDGEEITDIDVDAYLKRTASAKIVYAWSRVDNCRHQGAFQDPRQRTRCPTAGNFEELAHILDAVPPAPAFAGGAKCKKITPFKSPWIWKPMAEDKGGADPRANKPVAIIGARGPIAAVLAADGSEVGRLAYYGQIDNLYRFYSGFKSGSGVNGYEFEKKAEVASGSRWTWLALSGGACAGPVRTGRRAGSYR